MLNDSVSSSAGCITSSPKQLTVVETRDASRRATKILRGIGVYVGIGILCMAIAVLVLHLNWHRFSIPLCAPGDGYFFSMMVKNFVQNGEYNINRFVGAPGQMELYDFPINNDTHLAFLRVLALFSHNYAIVMNSYFLLGFGLIGASAYFVGRRLKLSSMSAFLVALLFAFQPYHFFRGEQHLTFSEYFSVPLIIAAALWVAAGEPLFRIGSAPTQMKRRISSRGVISLVACVLIGGDNPYYPFFGAFFLVVAAAIAWFRRKRLEAVIAAGILLTVLVLTFALNLAPNFVYWYKHGINTAAAGRSPMEAELFAMKITQLILPVSGHRLPALAHLKQSYDRLNFIDNENNWSTLGAVGTFGFLFLLFMFFLDSVRLPRGAILRDLSLFNLWAILLGTIGGFGSLFALLISPEIRSYNRIGLFIAFFSLLAIGIELDHLYAVFHVHGLPRAVLHIGVCIVIVLGILDQTTKYFVPDYRNFERDYASDAQFVGRIEASIPAGSMIFELPYMSFPNHGGVNQVHDYDHFRGYIHSHSLRWSYAAIRGRETDLWQRKVSAMPPPQMLNSIVHAGFRGIYLDRFGYKDGGKALESEIQLVSGATPLVSENQRLVFFDLSKMAEGNAEGRQHKDANFSAARK